MKPMPRRFHQLTVPAALASVTAASRTVWRLLSSYGVGSA
jgi:hypothetical protein